MAYVDEADLAGTGAGQGSAMVGFKQSGTGMKDQNAFTILKRTGVWLDDHPSADATGASNSSAAFGATLAEAAASGRHLIIPKGTFKTSAISLPTTGEVIIEGEGEDTVLTVNAASQGHILSMANGRRLRFYNCRLLGDGTTGGKGLNLVHTNDIDLDNLVFDDFGLASIYGLNSRGIKLDYDAEVQAFVSGSLVTGGTSGATGSLWRVVDNGTTGSLYLINATGTFQDNEAITGSLGGAATVNGAATVYNQIGERLAMRNIRSINCKNPGAGYTGQIQLWSGWRRITGYNLHIEGALGSATGYNGAGGVGSIQPSTDTFYGGVVITDVSSFNGPEPGDLDPAANYNMDVMLDAVRVIGGTGWGVLFGSEYGNPAPNNDFKLSNYTAENCGCAALKTKNVSKVLLNNIYATGCDRLGGECANAGLSGSLLLNGSDGVTVSNVVLENCGQEGVNVLGSWTGDTNGKGRGRWSFSNVVVNKSGLFTGTADPNDFVTTGAAFYSPFNTYDVVVTGLVANDVKEGIVLRASQDAGGTATPPARWVFNAPIIKRTLSTSGAAIRIVGDPARKVQDVIVNSPIIQDCAAVGINVEYCTHFEVNGGQVKRTGTVAGGLGRAIQFINTDSFKLEGVTVDAPTSVGTASSFHALVGNGSGNAYGQVYNCTLSGGTGNFLGTFPTEFRFRNNKGLLDGREVGGQILNAHVNAAWATWATIQRSTTTLTADRSIGLPAGLYNGMTFRVIRESAGAFDLNVKSGTVNTGDGSGGTLVKAMATATWAEFVWNGATWIVSSAGSL